MRQLAFCFLLFFVFAGIGICHIDRNPQVMDAVAPGRIWHDVTYYGALGNNIADDRGAINSASVVASADGGPVYFPPGTYKVSSDITITAGVYFADGAKLSVDAGDTVTINGIEFATNRQIFSGSGTVVLAAGATNIAYPQWWGAVGDGVTDDSAEIKLSFAAASACGARLVFVDTGSTYIFDGNDETLSLTDDLTVEGDGKPTIEMSNYYRISSTQEGATALTASASRGDRTITVGSSAIWSIGDFVLLYSNKAASVDWGTIANDIGVVRTVPDGTSIELCTPLNFDYDIPTDTVDIYHYTPRKFEMRNFNIQSETDGWGFLIRGMHSPVLENIVGIRTGRGGGGYLATFEDCINVSGRDLSFDGYYMGIVLTRCRDCYFDNIHTEYCSHAIDPNWFTTNVWIRNVTSYMCNAGMSSHPAFNVNYENVWGYDIQVSNLRSIGGSCRNSYFYTEASGAFLSSVDLTSDFDYIEKTGDFVFENVVWDRPGYTNIDGGLGVHRGNRLTISNCETYAIGAYTSIAGVNEIIISGSRFTKLETRCYDLRISNCNVAGSGTEAAFTIPVGLATPKLSVSNTWFSNLGYVIYNDSGSAAPRYFANCDFDTITQFMNPSVAQAGSAFEFNFANCRFDDVAAWDAGANELLNSGRSVVGCVVEGTTPTTIFETIPVTSDSSQITVTASGNEGVRLSLPGSVIQDIGGIEFDSMSVGGHIVGALGSETLPNTSFETWSGASPDIPTSWTSTNLSAGEMVSSTDSLVGTYSAKWVNSNGGANASGIYSDGEVLTANTYHLFSVWAKGDSGGEIIRLRSEQITNNFNEEKTLTGSWAKYSVVFDPGVDATGKIFIQSKQGLTQTFYVDDVSCKPVSGVNIVGVYDADVDGLIDQAAGGTELDTSGVTDGQILIGDSTGNVFALAVISSDITMTKAGVASLANDTVAVAEFLASQDWGDISTAADGTVSLDNDAVTEADLKEVGGAPADEDILTYESTVGDFEWHTLAELSIQPLDADLTAIAALSSADSNFIVGSGGGWVAESGATARTSIGLGTANTPQFVGLGLGGALSLGVLHMATVDTPNYIYMDTVDATVVSGANVAALNFRGGEAGVATIANILIEADQDWTATASGSRITFGTTTENTLTKVDRLIIDMNGNITTPAVYTKDVNGDTYRDVLVRDDGMLGYDSSTRRKKANITDAGDISWLGLLRPVEFEYKNRDERGNYLTGGDGNRRYGLIAEEVEEVDKRFVFYDELGRPEGVHYRELIAPLVKGYQDQQKQIDKLTKLVEQLSERVELLEDR